MREQHRPSRDPWAATFSLTGREHRYFFHSHNCGFPGRRRTERTVELALAVAGRLDHLCEVRFLVRNDDETWQQTDGANAQRPYGDSAAPWANAVCILERPARPATAERDTARFAL